MKIGVLTGGGDCPGLNSVLYGILLQSNESGHTVIGLEKGLLHSGGQQTFLNAMAMGKAVIVTDPEGAKDYIENGVDGILVPASDPDKLRYNIEKLINNPDLVEKIGNTAKNKVKSWDTEANLSAIVKIALKAL